MVAGRAVVEAARVAAAVVVGAAGVLVLSAEATHEQVGQPLLSKAQATTAPGLQLHW